MNFENGKTIGAFEVLCCGRLLKYTVDIQGEKKPNGSLNKWTQEFSSNHKWPHSNYPTPDTWCKDLTL